MQTNPDSLIGSVAVILNRATDPRKKREWLPTLGPFARLRMTGVVGLMLVLGWSLPAAEPPLDIFAYNRSAPLQVTEVGRETRGAAIVRDVSFVPVDQPVKAYLVAPADGKTGPAILYVHWLGEPSTTNRTEFLAEAVELAGRGVTSVLVDTMWAAPKWYGQRVPENDYAQAIHQVIELRRAMDLLLAQPGVDAARVVFVGHDFGAMYGMLASAADRRAKAYVFMAATPHFVDWFFFARQPKDSAAYRAQISSIDPVLYLPRLAPAPVFFQFAAHDEYVSAEEAAEYYAAAAVRKHMATYNAGHDLHTAEVAADRVAWVARELGLK